MGNRISSTSTRGSSTQIFCFVLFFFLKRLARRTSEALPLFLLSGPINKHIFHPIPQKLQTPCRRRRRPRLPFREHERYRGRRGSCRGSSRSPSTSVGPPNSGSDRTVQPSPVPQGKGEKRGSFMLNLDGHH